MERFRLVTQLGELMLDVGRLEAYAVPASAAADVEPPVLVPEQHTVDRFTCFKVKVPRESRAAVKATNLLVSGEFLDPPAFLTVKKPRRLCSPAATADAPMRTATRYLLCYDVGPAPSARAHGEHVRDAFASRTVDLGRPREACLLATKNPPQPMPEDLTPCGFQDVWRFDARAGQSVEVRVDTTEAATAADLCAELTCGELQVTGDDDMPCTFPPPAYACPRMTGIPTTDGTCFVSVRMCSTCANPDRAAYSLVVGVAGEEANPQLITDDSPPPP